MLCARLLPFVIEQNINILIKNDSHSDFLKRFDIVAQLVTMNTRASALDTVGWIKNICGEMHIPALKDFGLTESNIAEIVQQAKKSSSTKGNPVQLTDEELTQVLQRAM